ncbi:MAG: hypothetical protein PHU23_08090 [Dehalococcoidales bacterium]|jgi:hypothetical protein|nr:hypothetical protein [Dehalococcoidales bacterium]
MGSRDIGHREKKKPKKDVRKQSTITAGIEQPRQDVEVIRKGKKPRDLEEE